MSHSKLNATRPAQTPACQHSTLPQHYRPTRASPFVLCHQNRPTFTLIAKPLGQRVVRAVPTQPFEIKNTAKPTQKWKNRQTKTYYQGNPSDRKITLNTLPTETRKLLPHLPPTVKSCHNTRLDTLHPELPGSVVESA